MYSFLVSAQWYVKEKNILAIAEDGSLGREKEKEKNVRIKVEVHVHVYVITICLSSFFYQ